jgi:hypothetical protein
MPGRATKIELATLVALFGKSKRHRAVKELCERLKVEPEESDFPKYKTFFYNWKSKGLSLSFVRGKLVYIVLYAKGADGFKQYAGELPLGLAFSDTREMVEANLGPPRTSGGGGVIEFWAEYKKHGFKITYTSEDMSDMLNRIHHIGLIPTRK